MLSPREIAIRDGNKRYTTGKPCKHGHYADRFTITMNCVVCVKNYRKVTTQRLNQAKHDHAMGYIEVTVSTPAINAQCIRDITKMINGGHMLQLKLLGDYARAIGMSLEIDGH